MPLSCYWSWILCGFKGDGQVDPQITKTMLWQNQLSIKRQKHENWSHIVLNYRLVDALIMCLFALLTNIKISQWARKATLHSTYLADPVFHIARCPPAGLLIKFKMSSPTFFSWFLSVRSWWILSLSLLNSLSFFLVSWSNCFCTWSELALVFFNCTEDKS